MGAVGTAAPGLLETDAALGRRGIVFVGFMGAGKSTAAALAAGALGEPELDTDRLLEQDLGEAIESFFDREGEAAFRAREEELVCELLERRAAPVIALGGGAVQSERVREALAAEEAAGLHTLEGHDGFAGAVSRVRDDLVSFLIDARRAGRKVVGYGAPGKGNTLLNYCGIRSDLLAYTVDRNPYKHGRFTPGTRIPILPPEQIAADKPDYVLVLPWNLRTELVEQLSFVHDWGGRLVFPIPELSIVEVTS